MYMICNIQILKRNYCCCSRNCTFCAAKVLTFIILFIGNSSKHIIRSINKNIKFEQKLLVFHLTPCSHCFNIDKFKFNKGDWSTLTYFL